MQLQIDKYGTDLLPNPKKTLQCFVLLKRLDPRLIFLRQNPVSFLNRNRLIGFMQI